MTELADWPRPVSAAKWLAHRNSNRSSPVHGDFSFDAHKKASKTAAKHWLA